MLKPWLVAMALAAFSITANALDIHGVKVEETLQAADVGTPLVLNGAGVRTKFFVKVYVAALYLAQKRSSAEAVLSDSGARRISLQFLRELSAEKLATALDEGLAANNTPAELASLDAPLKEFRGLITGGGAVKEGATILLDYLPGNGTRVSLNGKLLGTIAGDKFNRALLRVWLGEHPVDSSLKNALLGN